MSKRKRFEVATVEGRSDESLARSVRSQRQQLETFIEYGKKNLFRSLKVARGFERQKLGRRQKTAKEKHDDAETARLEAEVAALKALDLPSTAESHLYRTLLKSKPVATSPALPSSVAAILDSSTHTIDVARANVTARLYNSNPVKTAMCEIMASINAVLGIEQQPNRKKRLRKADYEPNKPMIGEAESQELNLRRTEDISESGSHSGASLDIIAENSQVVTKTDDNKVKGMNIHEEVEEESDPEHDKYASRLANNSDSDSESAGDVGGDEKEHESEPTPQIGAARVAHDLSLTPSPPPTKAQAKISSTTAPTSTTFLPSLMMGGYWSGSDSASTIDDNEAEAANIQRRKNRMGQQARRALWEKKFGVKANHLKGQQSREVDREVDWDARKGLRGGDERGKRGRGRGRGGRRGVGGENEFGGRGSGASGANSERVVERKKKLEDGPLHPSWEAAKKAKEQKTTATFQGKKVVFD